MSIFRRIWALTDRSKLDRDVEAELREHLRMRIDANIAKGMTPEEAARDARLRFGNPTAIKERVDAEDVALGLDNFFRDISLALIATRAASTMLFGLKAWDAATLVFAVLLLSFIALLASWIPAHKASHLDPVAALRSE